MKIRLIFISLILNGILMSCGGDNPEKIEVKYDPKLGIGKYKEIKLSAEPDDKLVAKGDELYMNQCATCHKLGSEMHVGPGWKGVTEKRNPVWLMNLMTNTNEMLDNDPELKKQIELTKMRMPDFGLTHDEAIAILEFMRQNDKGKVSHDRELPEACKHTGR